MLFAVQTQKKTPSIQCLGSVSFYIRYLSIIPASYCTTSTAYGPCCVRLPAASVALSQKVVGAGAGGLQVIGECRCALERELINFPVWVSSEMRELGELGGIGGNWGELGGIGAFSSSVPGRHLSSRKEPQFPSVPLLFRIGTLFNCHSKHN